MTFKECESNALRFQKELYQGDHEGFDGWFVYYARITPDNYRRFFPNEFDPSPYRTYSHWILYKEIGKDGKTGRNGAYGFRSRGDCMSALDFARTILRQERFYMKKKGEQENV